MDSDELISYFLLANVASCVIVTDVVRRFGLASAHCGAGIAAVATHVGDSVPTRHDIADANGLLRCTCRLPRDVTSVFQPCEVSTS